MQNSRGTSPSFPFSRKATFCSLATSLLNSELTFPCQNDCKCWRWKSRSSSVLMVHAQKSIWFGIVVLLFLFLFINIAYGYKADRLWVMEWHFRRYLCDLRCRGFLHGNWHQRQSADMLKLPFETKKGILRNYPQPRNQIFHCFSRSHR